MSDISPHHTQIAKPTAAQPQTAAALKGGNGLFSGQAGMAFWDLILGQLGTTGDVKQTVSTPSTPVAATSDETKLLDGEADLALTLDESLLALLGEEGKTSDEEKPMSLFDILALSQKKDDGMPIDIPLTRVERVQKQIDLYQKLIDKLTAGLPLESKDSSAIDALIARLQKQTELLRTGKLNGEEAPLQLFIAMGLTPAQLTQVGEKIARLEEKLGRDITVEDIIAGVGQIIEPAKPTENTVLAPVPGKTPFAQQSASASPVSMDQRGRYQRAGEQPAHYTPANANQAATAGDTPAKIAASPASFQSTLASLPTQGDIALPHQWSFPLPDQAGFDIQTGLPMSHIAQAVHAATSISQAGQAHPATQLVSIALGKMAKAGSSNEMTIRMDPPELGRVLAKLQFGKDKSVKAVLMVEKPETYTMLIRDAASLERALQNAGLTTDSASLSFELAQDGSAFNSDNNGRGGGEPQGRNGTDLANDPNDPSAPGAIETTMTWQVDSETGYIRYNLLA